MNNEEYAFCEDCNTPYRIGCSCSDKYKSDYDAMSDEEYDEYLDSLM